MKAFLYSLVFFFSFSTYTLPCVCLYENPSDTYKRSDLIFIGLSVSAGEDSFSVDGPKSSFIVEKIFKGEDLIEVDIWSDWTDCGIFFPSGKKYLVYAYKSKDGKYRTGKCSRSELLKWIDIDLLYLNGLPETLSQTSIAGHIYNYEDPTKDYWDLPSFENVSVRIYNNKQSYETTTDGDGLYKFINIEPGKYRFHFGVNSKYTTRFSFDDTFEIESNQFLEVDQILVPNGIIAGKLTDIYGKPLSRVFVNIKPSNPNVRESSYILDGSSLTDTAGFFLFERVPPGDYYLGINIYEWDMQPLTLNYVKTYYPGVEDTSSAEKLTLAFGDSLTGMEFIFPFQEPIYYLKGSVTFEDTTLRVGGEIQLRTTNDPINSDLIERSNINVYSNFSMMLLEGMEGWIHVKVTGLYPESEDKVEFKSPTPIRYKAEKDIVNYNIIINKR